MRAVQIIEYILLGVVQGLTEFLPVSSSGHLLLAQHWLGLELPGVVTEVALHVATLLSVVLVYRAELVRIVRERDWRFIGLIALSTVVTVALIFPFREPLEALTQREDAVLLVAGMLLVTAMWLALADLRLRHPVAPRPVTPLAAVFIGVIQAVAILPGISRSGATIGMALQAGIERAEAARYSFILSLPVIVGAGILKLPELRAGVAAGEVDPLGLSLGFLAALLSGVLAIYIVLWMLQRARLTYFAAYCTIISGLAFLTAGL